MNGENVYEQLDQALKRAQEAEAQRDQYGGALVVADSILRQCENCVDDWLRAQNELGIVVRPDLDGTGSDGA